MFSKFKSRLLSPVGLLAAGLAVVTLLTALSGLWHYQYEVAHQTPAATTPDAQSGVAQTQSPAEHDKILATEKPDATTPHPAEPAQPSLSNSRQAITKSANQTTTPSSASSNSVNNPAPVASAQPGNVSLTLSVNGQSKGLVTLPANSTQCDLLTQALTQGVIASLDMRYSSQYKTEAVYVIDGVGDPGSIWWTYKVNGIAPPYGCAYMKVHNGDFVNWQYIKN